MWTVKSEPNITKKKKKKKLQQAQNKGGTSELHAPWFCHQSPVCERNLMPAKGNKQNVNTQRLSVIKTGDRMFHPATHRAVISASWTICVCVCVFQYYDSDIYPYMKDQKNFEQNVFNKTHKADSKSPSSPLFLIDVILPAPALCSTLTHVSSVICSSFCPTHVNVIPASSVFFSTQARWCRTVPVRKT